VATHCCYRKRAAASLINGQKTTRDSVTDASQPRNLVKSHAETSCLTSVCQSRPSERLIRAHRARLGIDRSAYVEFLTSTILYPDPSYPDCSRWIAAGKFQPSAFTAPSDTRTSASLRRRPISCKMPMPLAGLLTDRFLRLLARGWRLPRLCRHRRSLAAITPMRGSSIATTPLLSSRHRVGRCKVCSPTWTV